MKDPFQWQMLMMQMLMRKTETVRLADGRTSMLWVRLSEWFVLDLCKSGESWSKGFSLPILRYYLNYWFPGLLRVGVVDSIASMQRWDRSRLEP